MDGTQVASVYGVMFAPVLVAIVMATSSLMMSGMDNASLVVTIVEGTEVQMRGNRLLHHGENGIVTAGGAVAFDGNAVGHFV
jgi:hypothetical protein